ncbi:MAG TPA: hypothetical protein VFR87_17695 [Nocardioidaceae bacterium]|nr:hypothetical protein [Nocardioidaceae bacterium]
MSGLMNMVSKFTRGTRTTSGRARPNAPHSMGPRRGGMGHAPRGRVGGSTSSVEGMARRLMRKAR